MRKRRVLVVLMPRSARLSSETNERRVGPRLRATTQVLDVPPREIPCLLFSLSDMESSLLE